jgi:hypothetical protein
MAIVSPVVQDLRPPRAPDIPRTVAPDAAEWWRAAWHRLRCCFQRSARQRTALEERLSRELEQTRHQVYDREVTIFKLRAEMELLKSELLVKNRQLQLAAEVHELDRARVAADLASYARVVAESESRLLRRTE